MNTRMEAHLGGVGIDTSGLISRITVDVRGFRPWTLELNGKREMKMK